MSEMFVENMNSVQMTVEDTSNVEMIDPSEERIIQAISPDVEMERVEGGLKITITDKDGVHENVVYDGAEGEQGPQGEEGPAGQDGVNGQDGVDGQDGQDAFVYIRYSENEPTQDSDMTSTPSAWMGIYSGSASQAPTHYTDYDWYKIKGEQGSSGVQYASELEMSALDSTKADVAINGKVAIQQDVLDAGKALGIGLDGRVTPVPFSGDDFTGATASSDGVHGYVPAPLTGEQGKVLMGDGTWSDDIPVRLAAVENVYTDNDVTIASSDWTASNGSYVYTWTSALVTASCGIEVFLRDGAESAGIEDFDASKVTGGVQFTTDEQPTGSLPVTIRIINTKSDQLVSLSADEISTEAISGCDDVEEALGTLNSNLGSPSSASAVTGADAFSKIATLNSNKMNDAVRVVKTYSNVTISNTGYVTIDTYSGLEIDTNIYRCISVTVRGWSGASHPITLVKGSTGDVFYIMSEPQTISSVTVEYYFYKAN